MGVQARAPILSPLPRKRLPPDVLFPNVAILPATTPVTPTGLAALQSEFDAQGLPKKHWPVEWLPPNIATQPVPIVAAPPTLNLYDLPPRKKWPSELPPANIASLPTQAPGFQYDYPAPPKRKWKQDGPFPNIAALPVPTTPPPVLDDFPTLPKKRWKQEGPFPNIAGLPDGTLIPPFHYDYPSVRRKKWPVEAAFPNVASLPNADLPPALRDWPTKPKRKWPDPFLAPNLVGLLPANPIVAPPPFVDERPLKKRFKESLPSPLPLPTSTPILPLVPGFEIILAPRTFTLAVLARSFTLTLPPRRFIVSASMQSFEIKDPAESWPLTFNFASNLGSGETLVGPPSVSVSTIEGIDGNPFAILNGPVGFDSTLTQVIQPVSGGLNGCEYEIVVTCPTTNPLKILTLVGALPVRR